MKHIYKILMLIGLILVGSSIKAQNVEIGQSATLVKDLIELSIEGTNNNNRTWFIKNNDSGGISMILICYDNQYLIDFRCTATFCRQYIMANGKLARIRTKYDDLSLQKLKESYTIIYEGRIKNGLYYNEDYKHYSKLYIEDGKATSEYFKTAERDIPIEFK